MLRVTYRNGLHFFAFLYANNEVSEKEYKLSQHYIKKYLVINLTKKAKDLYAENYKMLIKEIKDYSKTWKDIPCSWTGRINIAKMTIPPKEIYKFNVLPWWLRYLQCRRARFDPRVRKIPWRREWILTPVFLPGEFHGQRSLVSYSSWGHKESHTTEAT